MPTIPVEKYSIGLPQQQIPRTSALDFGGAAYDGLTQMAGSLNEVAAAQRKQQDALDFSKQSGEYDAALNDLAETVKEEPDFQQREKLFISEAAKLKEQSLKNATNPSVRGLLVMHQAQTYHKREAQFRAKNQLDWNSQKMGDFAAEEESLASRIVATDDPQEIARLQRTHSDLVTMLSSGKYPAMDAEEAQKRRMGFRTKTLVKAATAQIRTDPDSFDSSDPKWGTLDLEARTKLGEQARAKSAQRDVQRDKLARDTKKIEMDQANAQANFGQLDPIRLDKALRGEDPYITPSEARHLKEVNEKPPTGEGNTAIGAIESAYKLKPRSLSTISRAFAELNNLQRQLGAPNPAITKLANELQSDQTALETQGIARQANDIAAQNRGISNLKNEYDASKPQMPKALEGIMGNHDAQNKAKIESEYRKNGPEAAKKMADSLAKGQKAKQDAQPEQRKKIQGLVR